MPLRNSKGVVIKFKKKKTVVAGRCFAELFFSHHEGGPGLLKKARSICLGYNEIIIEIIAYNYKFNSRKMLCLSTTHTDDIIIIYHTEFDWSTATI